MSRRIVECVPNISEGRNREVIDAVVKAASSVPGARVLDVDPGAATNRTVITVAGEPEAVLESAFRIIERAGALIDMSVHTGAHPRQGATDVCPFVPVAGVTMDECVDLARRLGDRVGRELGIPVYLYEKAATRPSREKLPDIREGEYEALPEKLGRPEWEPDFGPGGWSPAVARTGVTVIGARSFLVAYNVNLNTTDDSVAKEVALTIRDSGRTARDSNWKFIRDASGAKVQVPGLLQACKATGWFIREYNCAQVTMNLTDISVTPLHVAFETTRREVEKLGYRVTGSEIVGLVPLSCMLDAGRYYLEMQNSGMSGTGRMAVSPGLPERRLVEAAVRSMGLRDVAGFDPASKIIEYLVADEPVLSGMTCRDFADELSSDSPAPGGGSVAALIASLGAALSAMVANLTVKSRDCRAAWDEMREIAPKAQSLKEDLLRAIDDDTAAFNVFMDAMRRGEGVQEAMHAAAAVPMSVLERCPEIASLAASVAANGLPASLSDAGVAASCARSASEGAYFNVVINAAQFEDRAAAEALIARAAAILEETSSIASSVVGDVRRRLETSAASGDEGKGK
ncbi:MAG TPA: glutamate formimidoyltransferase [Candidatus Fermentibacter daniensis]|nr:glutamate formimidoyltransferase [Candidatus Fermentibacter daniensis]